MVSLLCCNPYHHARYYCRSNHKGTAAGWVEDTLRPRMHELVAISVAAAAAAGINRQGRPYAFELLGYDFMVDDNLRVWLIEVTIRGSPLYLFHRARPGVGARVGRWG